MAWTIALATSGRAQTSDEDTSAGRLEKVRAAIVEVVGLYGLRYQSDFPMLGSFIGTIWNMLVQTSLAPKNDLVRVRPCRSSPRRGSG